MRHVTTLAAMAIGFWMVGCESGPDDVGPVGELGTAEVALLSEPDLDGVQLLVTWPKTGKVMADVLVVPGADGSVSRSLLLPATTYLFHATALSAGKPVGEAQATVKVQPGVRTQVPLHIELTQKPAGYAPTKIDIDVNDPPQIEAVDVVPFKGGATLAVTATDKQGDAMTVAWAGFGVGAALAADGSSVTLTEPAALPATTTTVVVLQDDKGATTLGLVTFAPAGGCATCGDASLLVFHPAQDHLTPLEAAWSQLGATAAQIAAATAKALWNARPLAAATATPLEMFKALAGNGGEIVIQYLGNGHWRVFGPKGEVLVDILAWDLLLFVDANGDLHILADNDGNGSFDPGEQDFRVRPDGKGGYTVDVAPIVPK